MAQGGKSTTSAWSQQNGVPFLLFQVISFLFFLLKGPGDGTVCLVQGTLSGPKLYPQLHLQLSFLFCTPGFSLELKSK